MAYWLKEFAYAFLAACADNVYYIVVLLAILTFLWKVIKWCEKWSEKCSVESVNMTFVFYASKDADFVNGVLATQLGETFEPPLDVIKHTVYMAYAKLVEMLKIWPRMEGDASLLFWHQIYLKSIILKWWACFQLLPIIRVMELGWIYRKQKIVNNKTDFFFLWHLQQAHFDDISKWILFSFHFCSRYHHTARFIHRFFLRGGNRCHCHYW